MRKLTAILLMLSLAASGLMVGCAKKAPPPPPPAPAPTPTPAPPPTPPPAPPPEEPKPKPEIKFQEIFFDFDKSFIREDAKPALEANAGILKDNANVTIRIEGNCDERGTVEYNLALGQRRAEAAKKYLVDLGIEASRIQTISYGKERPRNPGHNEAAWQENRRDDFVIVSQ